MGIAGLAPGAELLVAKVVADNGTISVEAEAKAIHWAVDRGARVINISPRRAPRPRRPEPRHVLAARAAGDRVRRAAQRRRGRGGRQRRPGAAHAVALRELPGRAAARPRRERPRPKRRVADVLESRRCLQRRGRARRGRLLDVPAQAHRRSAGVPGPGIHAVRDRPVPAAGGHVVRRAAGHRGGGRHPRSPSVAPARAGDRADRAERRRLVLRIRLRSLRAGPRRAHRLGPARHRLRDPRARPTAAPARRVRAERRRGRRRVPPVLPGRREGPVRACLDGLLGRPGRRLLGQAPRRRQAVRLARAASSNGVVLALWRPSTISVTDLARQDLRIRLSNRSGRRERLAYTASEAGWYHLQVRATAPTADPVAYRLSIVRVR